MDEIQNLQSRYEILIQSEDMITIYSPDRIRLFVNKAYCSFSGKTERELVGQSILEEFSQQKLETYNALAKGLTRANPAFSMLTRSGTIGNEKWVKWSEHGIFDSEGNLIEVISIGKNVDDFIHIKKKNDEVNNILAAYKEAIDSNVICSITDLSGKILYANKLFVEVSGYVENELIGKSHSLINSGYHSAEFFKIMWKTILSGKMWHGEIRNRAKNGAYYWVKTVIIPILNADRELSNFLSLRVIISERKMLEEERNRYTQSLEELLHMVSHELRKPIANCIGLLNLLKTEQINEVDRVNIIDYLINSSNELDIYSQKMNDYLHANREHNKI